MTDEETLLSDLQQKTFGYFLEEINEDNGLVRDRTEQGAPCSVTAVGLALTAYPVAVERGYLEREEAVDRTLTTLRFFWQSPQHAGANATGYRGFYYHFLDMDTGLRTGQSELSSIDTTFLLGGILVAAAYFQGPSAAEQEIRDLADKLYRRVDWAWMQNGNGAATVAHGWFPETGFIPHRWEGYSEALLLYILGLGSPTHPLSPDSYKTWTKTYQWRQFYGFEYLFAAPLFIHQLSHLWIDLRGIQDTYMREKKSDYFENSRRATYAQQQYAIENPQRFKEYGEYTWGFSASAGPGQETREINGILRQFFGYLARGAPDGPDDGTLSPWAVVASLPFAPEIVIPTIRHFDENFPEIIHEFGYRCSFNPTYPSEDGQGPGWISGGYYGLDQGPIVLMIENHRTGRVWQWMRQCPYLRHGLHQAGFRGGWLSN